MPAVFIITVQQKTTDCNCRLAEMSVSGEHRGIGNS
eukprot:COSAG05_NODE_23954_length_254_cov_1.606452_1_plen_35_part_01